MEILISRGATITPALLEIICNFITPFAKIIQLVKVLAVNGFANYSLQNGTSLLYTHLHTSGFLLGHGADVC